MFTKENKYIYAKFSINTNGFDSINGFFENDENRDAFYSEIENLFKNSGWQVSGCDLVNGKSSLYVHPNYLLGAVRKELIPEICSILLSAETCRMWGWEKISEQYNITQEQAEEYLWSKQQEIEVDLARQMKTRSRKVFKHPDDWFCCGYGDRIFSSCQPLDNKVSRAAGCKVIPVILEIMAERRILVRKEINGKVCYRTRFKTEK